MDLKRLCVALQSYGIRMPGEFSGRKGGAGPSEGHVVVIKNRFLNVPTQSWFVDASPYSIRQQDGAFMLYNEEQPVGMIHLPTRPQCYDINTPSGVPLEKIALMHGRDCLASTVYQNCVYWNTEEQCAFCGIGISLANNATVQEKNPEDLGFAAAKARLHDGATHVTLTTGIWPDEKYGLEHLISCIKSIKLHAALPVHVQICPPENLHDLEKIKEAGAETVGLHIESYSMEILQKNAPWKARVGLAAYLSCWQRAVDIFGKNQVSSFLIAGMGEGPESILEGAEIMGRLGVFPYLLPLRPVPGTPLEGLKPPSPDKMEYLYEQLCGILKHYGLSSQQSKAGCVRCGACSALALYEK